MNLTKHFQKEIEKRIKDKNIVLVSVNEAERNGISATGLLLAEIINSKFKQENE